MIEKVIDFERFKAERSGELIVKKLIEKYSLNDLAQEKLNEVLDLIEDRVGKRIERK
jgi:hypothetical protein